ncbi:Mu transposase C-terminal domain-containing protein [Pseudoalteromonas sp. JB197]|uniref:Mu transposase C-terminal domain-containing protein n=1 Tax=Pseudoalteromonas sp. JB197 TaxID=1434839 RepID=UPI00097F5140|nr:Mu transposase C-terminal domain-containing protein [Pseudoalteromonas sp. JB197]PCC14197.1 transcriptional antiterminator [Pseudoalteromonas sp. JB197]SJN16560.1 Mobile element protein [Pseudoalteromonas sp. JB197]
MFLNQVYKDPHSEQLTQLRVVFEHIDYLMLIDINDANAWPYRVDINEFYSLGLVKEPDPITLRTPERSSKTEKARDRAFTTISPLLENYVDLFDKKLRNTHIRSIIEMAGEPRLYITRQLRRYWQRGMAPDALTPDYSKCGAPRKARRNTKSKLGRKRSVSPGQGMIITDEIAEIFNLAIEGFYLIREDVDLPKARAKAIGFIKSRYPTIRESELPTDIQFRYFFEKNYSKPEVIKAKSSSIEYEKDIAPLRSTAVTNNFGPGARYEIDATIADVYLVSNQDPDRIIGRPIIYKVKDVFSRLTVGLYVGLENPSWATASIALANTFCDKVEYCKQFGIDISHADWPSIGIPATITADRGELLGKHGDILVNRFGITLSNTRAYRGNDKGIVEKSFDTMHVDILPYVEGKVQPFNGKKKAGKRNELSANLTLFDFTKMVIVSEINRNTTTPLKDYDFESDMPTSLAPIPVKLWLWGIKNRTGLLREIDQKLITINLLPHDNATVSVMGICFKGLYYTCAEAVSVGWFHKNKSAKRPKSVEVAYNPLDTNIIYIRPDNQFDNYWTCSLQSRSRRYLDMTFTEAVSILNESRGTIAATKQKADYKAPDVQAELEKITKVAAERQQKADISNSSQRLHGIRENRTKEKDLERQKNRDSQKQSNTDNKATVTPINSNSNTKEDVGFDYPDLDDF